uniref:Uncharacterized protein n=1 Tax=Arundo donax TaxID=35708 RepID=A0A0A9AYM4_ARUDO
MSIMVCGNLRWAGMLPSKSQNCNFQANVMDENHPKNIFKVHLKWCHNENKIKQAKKKVEMVSIASVGGSTGSGCVLQGSLLVICLESTSFYYSQALHDKT